MTDPPQPKVHTLSYSKSGQLYFFRFEEGQEGLLIDELARLAKRPDVALDWFDVRVVSHQIGLIIRDQLLPYLPKPGGKKPG